MATIIVETGAIVANANSYVTVAEADTYWSDRNDTVWSDLEPAAKQAALIIAAQYLEWNYEWKGSRISSNQNLVWPRYLPDGLDEDERYIANNVVPPRVKSAQIELAYVQAVTGDLQPNVDSGGLPTEVKLGPLSVKYATQPQTYRTFAIVDSLLSELVSASQSGLTMKSVRA